MLYGSVGLCCSVYCGQHATGNSTSEVLYNPYGPVCIEAANAVVVEAAMLSMSRLQMLLLRLPQAAFALCTLKCPAALLYTSHAIFNTVVIQAGQDPKVISNL